MQMVWKRRITIAVIIAGVYAGYKYLLPVAFPFVLAWILAVWIYPFTVKLEKYTRIKRRWTGGLILFAVFGAVGIAGYFLLKELAIQIQEVMIHLPDILEKIKKMAELGCIKAGKMTGMDGRVWYDSFMNETGSFWTSFSGESKGTILVKAVHYGKSVLFCLSGTVVVLISAMLFMGDMENIRRKIREYTWISGAVKISRRLGATTLVYLKTQLIIIVAVAAVCAAGIWMMGNPYFFLLGAGLAVFDAIPLIGTGLFLYPAALILVLRKKIFLAVGCVLLDVVTSFTREYLESRLLGKGLGFSPVVVLASVYFGILLFGIWGVFLGPLSFSTVYEIGKEWDLW